MKLQGFELANIYLSVGEHSYDLHNDFDFCEFSYNVKNRILVLHWVRGTGAWVPKDSPTEIVINMQNVSYLSVSPREFEMPYTEDKCLHDVSFVEPSNSTEYSFIPGGPINPELHFVFQFLSGLILRVQAEEASCHISSA